MLPDFQLTSGSVAGRDHRSGIPRNNQDAACIRASRQAITAFVADGCGSSPQSELGAIWGVNVVSTLVQRHLERSWLDAAGWGRIKKELVSKMHVKASEMNPSVSQAINDFFLFTLVGAVITEKASAFVAIGDGVVAVNGETLVLKPNAGNQPTYLGYAITGSDTVTHEQLDFRIVCQLPTRDLRNFLVATDGAGEFIVRSDDRLPGNDKPLGPLSQFWTDNRYFDQTTATTRHLNLGARDAQVRTPSGRFAIEGGLLSDDTTLVAGRRR